MPEINIKQVISEWKDELKRQLASDIVMLIRNMEVIPTI